MRTDVFPTDTRRLMDMRRTGNVEAVIGGAAPTHLAAKLSDTLAPSNQIFDPTRPSSSLPCAKLTRPATSGIIGSSSA